MKKKYMGEKSEGKYVGEEPLGEKSRGERYMVEQSVGERYVDEK